MSGVPICERLGRLADNIDDLGIPTRDGATLRAARDTIEALVEALEVIEAGHGCPSAVASNALSRARNGGQP